MSLISEAMVATTGILGGIRPVTTDDQRTAEALLFSITARAAAFIAMEKQRPFDLQPQRDIKAARASLGVALTDTAKAEAVAGLSIHDPVLAADYLETLQTAREVAYGAYPLTEVPSISGPVEEDPPEDERQEWLALLAILEDVERLIDELEMYALTASQVEKFKLVYPELHAFLASVFDEEMAEQKVRVPGWIPSEDKESALRIFKGMAAEQSIRPLPPPLPKAKPTDGDEAKEPAQSVGQRALYR